MECAVACMHILFAGEIPPTMGNLGKLEVLQLAGNPFMDWPTPIHKCGNLKHVDLSRCRISEVCTVNYTVGVLRDGFVILTVQ